MILTHHAASPATILGHPGQHHQPYAAHDQRACCIAGPVDTEVDAGHGHRRYKQEECALGDPGRNSIPSTRPGQHYRQAAEADDGEHHVAAGEAVGREVFAYVQEGGVGAGACDYALDGPVDARGHRHEGHEQARVEPAAPR